MKTSFKAIFYTLTLFTVVSSTLFVSKSDVFAGSCVCEYVNPGGGMCGTAGGHWTSTKSCSNIGGSCPCGFGATCGVYYDSTPCTY